MSAPSTFCAMVLLGLYCRLITVSKAFLLVVTLYCVTIAHSAVAQQGGYKPDPKKLREIEVAEKKYIEKRNILIQCAWEQIAILSKANESADITARGAKSWCSREWLIASDAFGDLVNARFEALDGKRIENYRPTFDENMLEDFRALVLRYRGLAR